jgi:hypothetical protein
LQRPRAQSRRNFDEEVVAVMNTKVRIATGATVLGLAGLAGVALSANHQAADVASTKPAVRTKVINRTIHVTKHARPPHPRGAGPRPGVAGAGAAAGSGAVSTGASSTGSTGSSYSPVTTSTSGAASGGETGTAPVVTQTSGSAAAGGETGTPVTTATSGAGATGGGGGGESEGGGRDD